MIAICAIDGCERPANAWRGWCQTHYKRWRRTGDPVGLRPYPKRNVADRLWEKVNKNGPGGCWLWEGYINDAGYGKIWLGGESTYLAPVHRVSYELLVGPIPDGLHIDHVYAWGCRHHNCVNPAHLEAVTPRENTMRGNGPSAIAARKTHCLRGHALTEDNIYRWHKVRQCLTCKAERKAAYRSRS